MGGLMKIKRAGIIEKYVKIRLYPQQAPTTITHIDIPENAIVDGVAVYSDPGVLTHVGVDTSVGPGGYRDFDCGGDEPCVFYASFELADLFRYVHGSGNGDLYEFDGGDQQIFNARITHIEAYALSTDPEAYSILLVRLLCVGECEPRVWTEHRRAL
jgi:hypothetical protein